MSSSAIVAVAVGDLMSAAHRHVDWSTRFCHHPRNNSVVYSAVRKTFVCTKTHVQCMKTLSFVCECAACALRLGAGWFCQLLHALHLYSYLPTLFTNSSVASLFRIKTNKPHVVSLSHIFFTICYLISGDQKKKKKPKQTLKTELRKNNLHFSGNTNELPQQPQILPIWGTFDVVYVVNTGLFNFKDFTHHFFLHRMQKSTTDLNSCAEWTSHPSPTATIINNSWHAHCLCLSASKNRFTNETQKLYIYI